MDGAPTQPTVPDQAASLRRLTRRSERRAGYRIAITSGKGGVGKTNVAVNLAVCLGRSGRRVTLVDLDMGLANADVLLGVQPRFNLSHVLTGKRELNDIAVPAAGGIRFIAGGSANRNLANMGSPERDLLVRQLNSLSETSEIIIYDCGAGISENVLKFASTADVAMVVSTPEPTSVTDAYAMIKVLVSGEFHGRVELLVNMARSRAEARAVYRRVAAVAERFLHFPLADAGFVLQDGDVELAVRGRSPVVVRYPRCPSSLCVTALAARMVRTGLSLHRPRNGNLLARFVGLFA